MLMGWTKFDTDDKIVYMRNTITKHGFVTQNPYIGNGYYGQIEISPRRLSIIEQYDDIKLARIISISYEHYDTSNEPAELFAKYVSQEYVELVSTTIDFDWDGSAQDLYDKTV